MKRMLMSGCAVLMCVLLGGTTIVAKERTAGSSQGEQGSTMWKKTQLSGTIEQIDAEQGTVTIKPQAGDPVTMALSAKIDTAMIKEGDQVSAEYYQSLLMEAREPTAQELQNPMQSYEGSTTAPQGEEPMGGTLRQVKAVVDIESVDSENKTVTIKGPEGNSMTLPVQDSTMLESLQQGQQRVVTYTEALGISVEKSN
jgi:Cu/Ag efflux protein CusF